MTVMHSRTRTILLLLVLAAACRRERTPVTRPEPATGATVRTSAAIASATDVLRRTATAFPEAPQTVMFTQVNTVTLSSGPVTLRQRVIVAAPRRMRVDFLPLASQNGAIYRGRRAYTFARGRRAAAQAELNPMLLLGFGVFRQSPEQSREALEALGVKTSVMRRTTYNGNPTWVIGAERGDTTSNQVWIDADRWVPVRVIQSEDASGRRRVADTRFTGHTAANPTIPRVVEVYRDGRRAMRGVIEDVRIGVPVPAAAFDTTALRPVSP